MRVGYRIATVVVSLALMLVISACSGSDATSCEENRDCELGEICVGGFCEDENPDDDDQQDDQDDQDQDDDNGDGQNGDNGDDNGENGGTANPQVDDVYPQEGSTNVAVDIEIRVTFDQDIAETYLTDGSIEIRTPSGNLVDASLEYVEDDREIIVTPNEDLREGTRYTIQTTSDIRGAQGLLPLAEDVRSWFITEWDPDEDTRQIAERYAPIVYQDTPFTEDDADVHLDIPTRVDFDGNFDATDNLSNAAQASTDVEANLYYSVVSTETHHYIQYVLYYPGRYYEEPFDSGDTYEHDFIGLVVVVDREQESIELIDAVDAGETSGDDQRLTYLPEDSSAQPRSPVNEDPLTVSRADFEQEERFPLYVPGGTHAPCYWHNRTADTWLISPCTGADGEFASKGVVMRPGDEADTYDDADDEETEHLEMSYQLQSFYDPFWLRRGDYSCGLFSSPGYVYDPPADRPAGPNDESAQMARSLCSDDDVAYGTVPYRWRGNGSTSSPGIWFLDPAYYITTFYEFEFDDEDKELSLDYCYHELFEIDRRDEAECQLGDDDDDSDDDDNDDDDDDDNGDEDNDDNDN